MWPRQVLSQAVRLKDLALEVEDEQAWVSLSEQVIFPTATSITRRSQPGTTVCNSGRGDEVARQGLRQESWSPGTGDAWLEEEKEKTQEGPGGGRGLGSQWEGLGFFLVPHRSPASSKFLC